MTWQAWIFAGLWLCTLTLNVQLFKLNNKVLDVNEELLDEIRRLNGGDS